MSTFTRKINITNVQAETMSMRSVTHRTHIDRSTIGLHVKEDRRLDSNVSIKNPEINRITGQIKTIFCILSQAILCLVYCKDVDFRSGYSESQDPLVFAGFSKSIARIKLQQRPCAQDESYSIILQVAEHVKEGYAIQRNKVQTVWKTNCHKTRGGWGGTVT